MKVIKNIADVPSAQFDALGDGHPLTSHAFLAALEQTGCVGAGTGWQPEHLTWWEGDTLTAALPLYRKTDSYGEFVFDWAWARAFTDAGGAYYPKLVSALPFTPCPGNRLVARDAAICESAIAETLAYARDANVSSLHILLCDGDEAARWGGSGAMLRTGVQFHWTNPGARTFDDYLATMNHDKRKRIKQERRKVRDAGVTFRILYGDEITEEDWAHFYRCTAHTFGLRGSTPYLTHEFFLQFAVKVPSAQLLVIGELHGQPICAALNWLGAPAGVKTLYGRYWGALEYVPGLHFEACYYQALTWCIENAVQRFEGGAQGEHKLARGFLPTKTHSGHWIAHAQFAEAVNRFLVRERAGVSHALSELEASSPFKAQTAGENEAESE